MSSRNLWTAMAAVAGFAFLVVMVVSGALPQQRQLVKFEAKGFMKLEPELVSRVELHQGERKAVLLRGAGGEWIAEGGSAVVRRTREETLARGTDHEHRRSDPRHRTGRAPGHQSSRFRLRSAARSRSFSIRVNKP